MTGTTLDRLGGSEELAVLVSLLGTEAKKVIHALDAKATAVSFGFIVSGSAAFWLVAAMILSSDLSTLLLSFTVFLVAALAVAWACGGSIYRWWLRG